MNAKSALTIALAAGIASTAAASNTPTTLSPDVGNIRDAGHIYYNAVTGERVVTVIDQVSGADTGTSTPIWTVADVPACEDFGYMTAYFFGVDNPGTTSLSTNVTNLDHGDIAMDKVVDCITIDWVSAHADTDSDSDSIGDGVEELAGQWMVWDADNGRGPDRSSRLAVANFLFFNLPGNIFGADALTGYTLDVDLVGGFSSDLSFELGDSDGDCQTAAFCNNDVDTNSDGIGDGVSVANADRNFDGLPDSDLDADGLFDFAWTVRFFQPGTGNDFDSDSDTGSAAPTTADTIGISFGAPEGSAVDNGDGTFSYNIDTSVDNAGTGLEDRFGIYGPPTTSGDILYAGGFWFGGITCTGDTIDVPGGGFGPPAFFVFNMYGPSEGGCDADINNDQMLNFFDVSAFLADYQAGGDYNGDGSTTFFDVSAFLGDYQAGCIFP